MKKIMIALAIAAFAVVSQGASVKWSGSNVFAGNTTDKYSGTAYLFDSAVTSQQALFDAFAAAVAADTTFDIASMAIDSQTVSASGAIASKTSTYGDAATSYQFYFAIVDGDNMYLSNLKDVTTSGSDTTATTVSFSTQNNKSTTFSSVAAAEGFQGAGYWSAAPEPTSGLLLLLGMAGLALRRKQA